MARTDSVQAGKAPERVMMDGKRMDAGALRAQGGISRQPAWEE